jgi:deferrochelatase/peroxidase EfeB
LTNQNFAVKIQEGIFHNKQPFKANHTNPKSKSNDTFGMIFIRIGKRDNPNEIKRALIGLWKMYGDLKMGNISDLPGYPVPAGQISVLIGYGPNIFDLEGVNKKMPMDFRDRQFLPANKGAPIANGSGINYSHDECHNFGLSEDIVIQIISKTQLATYRAIVETKKYIIRDSEKVLRFSNFLTGFQRDDGRSWLGFHDEVSNMVNSTERMKTIAIDNANNKLIPRDYWTIGGTYLAILKIEIDLDFWNQVDRNQQELIVGRDKLTGTPIVGVDKTGSPVLMEGSPSAYDVTGFHADFHDHPDYFKESHISKRLKSTLDLHATSVSLTKSHIGSTRHIDNIDSKYTSSRRILRQGYEFLEPVNNIPGKDFRVGLNFISFQNDPSRLFFILTHPDWMGNKNFGGDESIMEKHKLLSVVSSGVFFVPPVEKPFPGISLFKQ